MAQTSLFLGCSTEAESVAREIQHQLEAKRAVDVRFWKDVFEPSTSLLQQVLFDLQSSDFALMLATPDNTTLARNALVYTASNNVIAEIGMAVGILGPQRVFVVHPEVPKPTFPTDFDGFISLAYADIDPKTLAGVVQKIIHRVRSLGPRSADSLLANARVITEPRQNYQIAKDLLRRGFRERLEIYEVSDSRNEDEYEDEWRKLMQKVNPANTPRIYRLFDREGANRTDRAILDKWAELSKPSNQSWFHAQIVSWPVDLLILTTQGGQAVEALVGMSNADRDRWMAVNTTNAKWIELLSRFAEVAAGAAPKKPIREVIDDIKPRPQGIA